MNCPSCAAAEDQAAPGAGETAQGGRPSPRIAERDQNGIKVVHALRPWHWILLFSIELSSAWTTSGTSAAEHATRPVHLLQLLVQLSYLLHNG